MLEAVDRRTAVAGATTPSCCCSSPTACGREVAALTLDDLDWKRERLHVRERKAGHVAAYPCRRSWARRCSTTCSTAARTTDRPPLFFRHPCAPDRR